MKMTRWKRLLAGILCALMVLQVNIPMVSQAADAQTSETKADDIESAAVTDVAPYSEDTQEVTEDGSFILSAVTESQVLIEPVKVDYTKDQSVQEALASSGYEFGGIQTGFVSSIQGVEGNFVIFFNDGDYTLGRKPGVIDNKVTVVAFTENSELYSVNMAAMIQRMGEYNAMTNGVKNYAPAQTAYQNALKGLYTADSGKAGELLEALNQAIAAYEQELSKPEHTLTVEAMQGGNKVDDLELAFTDTYGNVTTAEGTSIELRDGDYTFSISDGSYNRTEGSVTVNGSTVLPIELPSGQWFGEVRVLRNNRTENYPAYAGTCDLGTHTAEYFIEDVNANGSMNLYVERGGELPEGAVLRANYIGTSGTNYASINRSWESSTNALAFCIAEGMEGREIPLDARYTSDAGYTMIQSYRLKITRIPTCSDIVLRDGNGTSLLTDFSATQTEYTLNTIDSVIEVETSPYGEEGYTISVDAVQKESGNRVKLQDGENTFSVRVSYKDGQKNTYTFTVNKIAAAEVTLTMEEGVTAEIFNANDNLVSPKEGSTYELIPGENYYYVGTVQENYHTRAEFTAEAGTSISVAAPEVVEGISDFAAYDNSNKTTRKPFSADKEFSADIWQYRYTVSDALSAFYAQATPADGYTVDAVYRKQTTVASTNGVLANTRLRYVVDESGSATSVLNVIRAGGYGNTITLHVFKTSGDVTYYQDYVLDLVRSLHLRSMEASIENESIAFCDKDGEALEFDRDITDYYAVLPASAEKITVNAHFTNEQSATEYDGGYYAVADGVRYEDLSELEFSLDTSKEEETKEIRICHTNEDTESSVYRLVLKKQNPVDVTFRVDFDDAADETAEKPEPIFFVVSQLNNEPVFAENGVFRLMPGVPYTYTVTANGYVSQKVTDYKVEAGSGPVQISVTMAATAAQKPEELEAVWPSLRDENNNGIISANTPIQAEDTVLYWANKTAFTGYCGNPILVDGYLYTYDNEHIYKMDTLTGEVVLTSPDKLVAKSSFSIQPPTYGGGMVFVGLSGGKVQAFDAKTLESLWVYTDDLGGQPNSTITYKDGYVYTGFWNNETKDANYVCLSVADEDPEDGFEEKTASWTHTQAGGYYWAGSYNSDEFMLVGTDDGESGYTIGYAHVLSIHPKTGKVLDDIQLPHVGDLRSNITYDCEGENPTYDYYFTTKGGYFYRISVNEDGTFKEDSLKYVKLENGTSTASMSTSTPTVYNGRAYVGVAGSSQFGAYSGHNIAVIDLASMETAYSVPTQGYPQTSGLLTTAYDTEGTGKVYVYFFDNYTPGKLRVISDQPGQTEAAEVTQETNKDITYDTAYVLFTPSGAQAQYALCTPIADEYGTLYFRNDSNHMMALGATIQKIEVTKLPDKTAYKIGDAFDPTGMQVTATYTNGTTRDITRAVSYSEEALQETDTDFPITYEHVLYQNKDGETGVEYTAPMTAIQLQIVSEEEAAVIDKIEAIGEVTLDSEAAIKEARAAYDALPEDSQAKIADYAAVLTDAEAALKELQKNDNITCYVRAEGKTQTEVPLTKVTLNKHEIPSFASYGLKGAPDDMDYITPLHLLLQAMKDRGMEEELAQVDIASAGWINSLFDWGADNLCVSGGIDLPDVSAKCQAEEGKVYTFYGADGDWGSFGYTAYGFFGEFTEGSGYTEKGADETWEKTAETGEPVEFTYLYTSSMHTPQNGPCYDADGGYAKVYVGKDGAETVTEEDYRNDITVDSEGKFAVTFDKAGTYVVSARYYTAEGMLSASSAYCKITVKDTAGDEAAAVIEKIEAIGEVTLDSETAIKEARAAYDALSQNGQARVTNYTVLTDAEAALKELQKNDNITCYVRAEGKTQTEVPLTKVTLNKHEIPSFASYGLKGAPDDVDYITPLHLLLQAMKDRGMEEELAQVDIASAGWINSLFDWGADNLCVSGGIDLPDVSAKCQAEEGKVYTFYGADGDWGSFGYTAYGFFGEFTEGSGYTEKGADETWEKTAETGEPVEFTYLYTSSMHTPQNGPCYDADGGYAKVYVGKDGAETVTEEDYRNDITVDSEGKFAVTFDKAGTYVVSARYYTAEGKLSASSAYCRVTVKEAPVKEVPVTGLIVRPETLSMEKGTTQKLEVTVLPENATDKSITWISDNENAATVDAQGTVTAVEKGEATITAETANGRKAHCKITVKDTVGDEAAAVVKKIAAIGEVTLESEAAITDARKAYDALSEKAKEKVTNYQTLADAEAKLQELKDAAKKLPFLDVNEQDWFVDYVTYVYENQIMTGLNNTHFGPYDVLARAQFAMILYRMNGTPKVDYTTRFPDVQKGEWYTDAILWAAQTGVVTGYTDSGLFGPSDYINREQMAVMMYRYVNYKGYKSDAPADISNYKDAVQVSEFAEDAMKWAVGNGIIEGKVNDDGVTYRLDPQGNASRVECATIIMRFKEKFETAGN